MTACQPSQHSINTRPLNELVTATTTTTTTNSSTTGFVVGSYIATAEGRYTELQAQDLARKRVARSMRNKTRDRVRGYSLPGFWKKGTLG